MIDVGLEFLLQTIGELEVNKRALADDNTAKQARIEELEKEVVALKDVGEPTPIIAKVVEDVGD